MRIDAQASSAGWQWTAVNRTRRERRALRRHHARRVRMAGTVRREIKMSAAIIRMIDPYTPDALE